MISIFLAAVSLLSEVGTCSVDGLRLNRRVPSIPGDGMLARVEWDDAGEGLIVAGGESIEGI